jgi:chromosome segregation ATPase
VDPKERKAKLKELTKLLDAQRRAVDRRHSAKEAIDEELCELRKDMQTTTTAIKGLLDEIEGRSGEGAGPAQKSEPTAPKTE